MAKGRKLTTSRSERFLGSLGYYNQGQGTAANGASELVEEDVWSVVDDTGNGGYHSGNDRSASRDTAESNVRFDRRNRSRRPHDNPRVGGLSLAFHDSSNTSQRIVHQCRPQDSVAESPRGRHLATSTPVNVPDWSKIYRVDSVESFHDSENGLDHSELVPPHVYLAREYARSSVFEGVGRTLKGRDLSRVRDAVWSQTGFYG